MTAVSLTSPQRIINVLTALLLAISSLRGGTSGPTQPPMTFRTQRESGTGYLVIKRNSALKEATGDKWVPFPWEPNRVRQGSAAVATAQRSCSGRT